MHYTLFFACFLFLIVVLPALVFLYECVWSPKKGRTKYFRDKDERILFFHGVNICNSSKWATDRLPWHKKEDYQKLKDHGFNLVRFLVFWEAIEPEPSKYDLEYIKKVREHISILNDLGISVLLDVHQDLYNKKFSGNGFPDWTLPKEETPFKHQEPWYKNYTQKAVQNSYKHFWNDSPLKMRYTNMLIYLQEQFENTPNVIGIDVMNEPFPTLPRLFNFEKKVLAEFYQYIVERSRASNCSKIPFFFEPGVWCSTGIPTQFNEGIFTPWRNFIPHYYPPLCHNKGVNGPISKWLMKVGIRAKAREAQNMGSPYILGEFGLGVGVKNRLDGIKDFLNLANKYNMSWMWWSFDKEEHSTQGMLDATGNPNEVMKALTQAYPQKVAGFDPVFRNEGNTFYLEYTSDKISDFPTEVYVPGTVVEIKSNTTVVQEITPIGRIVEFYHLVPGKQTIEIKWQSS